MKKIYVFLLAVLVAGGTFAQNLQMQHFKKQIGNMSISNSVKPISTNVLSQSKEINAALNENFDNPVWTPAGWDTIGSPLDDGGSPSGWKNSSQITPSWETAGTPSGHFAYFDCFLIPIGGESSLVTPVLHPVTGDNTLAYNANYYLLNSAYIWTGTELFIEFSTDGGSTWTTSTTNVLAALPNYNVSSTGWQPLTVDLSAYNNGAVQVRFRAVSDYGGFALGIDDVTGPNADILISVNDVSVLGTYADFAGYSYYEITPLSQVIDVNLAAVVSNNGSAAQTNVTLTATDAANAISGTAVLASQASGSQDTLIYVATLDNTTPLSYAFSMNVTQTETDEVPANNVGDSIFFDTDNSLYLRSSALTSLLTSYSFGAGAPAITGMEFGCNYLFLNNDQIDSIMVLIYGANGTGNVTGKLYNMDLSTGVRTEVASTAPYTPSGVPEIVNLPLTTPYAVTAPAILTGTAQLNINISANDTIKIGADGGFIGDESMACAAYLNVGGTWGWYYITGTVPFVGLVNDFGTGINNLDIKKDVFVYPNPASSSLYVVNQKALSVEIFNLTGDVVAKYNNQNVINVSGIAQGTYFVKVITDKKVITEKINIVH